MSQLIKKIEGYVLPYITSDVKYVSQLVGSLQKSDFINIYGLTGFLQNLINVDTTINLQKPMEFGVKNNYNSVTVMLEINY